MEKYKVCTVDGCTKTMRWGRHCAMHKARLRKTGELGGPLPKVSQHGQSAHPLYHTWENLRARCNNPRNTNYKWYGARGIKVCDRWDNFAKFLDDVGERPEGLTLDRINNDGDYEPCNVRWVTQLKQLQNQRVRKSNKTGVSGVWYDKTYEVYRVSIRFNYINYTLGSYKKLPDAIKAREAGEKKYRE